MSLPTNFFIGRGGGNSELYEWAAGTSIRVQSNYTSGSGYLREGMSVNKFRNRIIASNSAASSWVNNSAFLTMEASYTGVGVWTVPYDGLWKLEAGGAGGGTSTHNATGNNNSATGGSGAVVGGYYNLLQGEEIYLLPGQTGSGYNEQPSDLTWAAGGGGSFIWRKSEVPLGNSPTSNDYPILAAGGGGGGSDAQPLGMDASIYNSGTSDRGGSITGGSSGNSGSITNGAHPGSAGAGWRQNGLHAHTVCTFTSQTAYSPTFGGYGGQGGGDGPAITLHGGFGGGGGGAQRCGSAGGGGGGGYSGGAGGDFSGSTTGVSADTGGGGGGSHRSAGTGLYASVSNPSYTNGYIEITAPV